MPTAVEYILHIDGITTGIVNIPFESYSFSAANIGSQSSGSGAGAGKVTFNPFSITKKIDRASPLLFKACITGQHIKSVTLELLPAVQKGTATPFLVVVLKDVLVSGISEAGDVHGGIPLEEIVFRFRTFQVTVDGVTAGYDIDLGKVI